MTRDQIPITIAAFCFLLWLVLAVRCAVRQRARREGRSYYWHSAKDGCEVAVMADAVKVKN